MRRMLSVTFFTGLLTLLRMGAGFLISKIIAVQTGPSGLALLAQIQNLATILNGVVSSPVSIAMVRYTSENISEGYKACAPWWRASMKCAFTLLLIIIPTCIFFSKNLAIWLFNDISYAIYIKVIAILLPLSVLGTAINSVINGQQFYKKYIALGTVSVVVSTIIMILMIYNFGIKGALVAASIQLGIIGFVSFIICIKEPWLTFRLWIGKTNNYNLKGVSDYMAMAVVSVAAMPISLMALRYGMANYLGWDLAGEWQLVWKISEVYLSVITISLGTYYLPKLAKLTTYEQIVREVNKTALVVLPIVIILALFVFFARDFIISILFSKEFHNARDLFAVQLAGDVIKIIGWIYAYPMISTGAKKWFIMSELIFCSSLFIISYYLMTIFGVHGVNMGYLINYVLYFMFVSLNLKRIIQK